MYHRLQNAAGVAVDYGYSSSTSAAGGARDGSYRKGHSLGHISITAAPAPPQSFLCGLSKHRVSIFYSSSSSLPSSFWNARCPHPPCYICGDCYAILTAAVKIRLLGNSNQYLFVMFKNPGTRSFHPVMYHREDKYCTCFCDEDISVLIQVTRSGSGETKLIAVFLRKLGRSTRLRFTSGLDKHARHYVQPTTNPFLSLSFQHIDDAPTFRLDQMSTSPPSPPSHKFTRLVLKAKGRNRYNII